MLRWRTVVGAAVVMGLVGLAGVSVAVAQAACTRTYRGDLVLEGNERLVITEGVLCVGGEIILRDNARLEISNAVLRMTGFEESLWDPVARIELFDDARLVFRHVLVESPRFKEVTVSLVGRGASRVEVEALQGPAGLGLWISSHDTSSMVIRDTDMAVFDLAGSSDADIRDSTIGRLQLLIAGSSRVEVADLRQGYYAEWAVPRGQGASFSLLLQDTQVEGWAIQTSGYAQVTIRDSENVGVGLHLASLPDEIGGMGPWHHALWALRSDPVPFGTGNLTLINTSVVGWDLTLWSRTAPLNLRGYEGSLWVWNSQADLRFEDTTVHAFWAADSRLVLDCAPLAVGRFRLDDTRLTIRGQLVFETDPRVMWDSSSVGREYEVQVRGRDGQPARALPVRVEDPLGRIITYTSDQDGVVRFTIWFSDTTYDKTWHLLVPQGDGTARVPITLLTTTPVQVTAW